MPWTLCLNTSTIRPLPLLEKIRLTAEAGFAGVELWINDLYEHVGRGGEISQVERALADFGLIVPCMIAMRQWGEASDLEYPLMLEEAKRRMELAARLGAPFVVATPPREPCPRTQLVDRYGDLLDIGRQVGVKPTFEYISFFQSVPSLSEAWQIVQQVDDPDATLILDAFHNWNSHSTLDPLREAPIERISHYHINDAAPNLPPGTQTDPDRVMPGDGPIDLAAELALLHQKGYQGAISLELFNRQLWQQPPEKVLQQGFERVSRLLAAIPSS